MGVFACQKEVKVVFLCQFRLPVLMLRLPPGEMSMVLPFPEETGATHFLPSTCSTLSALLCATSIGGQLLGARHPSRSQGRKDERSGPSFLMHAVWKQRTPQGLW